MIGWHFPYQVMALLVSRYSWYRVQLVAFAKELIRSTHIPVPQLIFQRK
jgi:hypothetical protein